MKRRTKRRENRGRGREEERRGERGGREEKKRTTTENKDLPPAAALAALRVPDSSASEEPAALSPLTAPQTQNQFVILLPLLFLFRSTFFKRLPRKGQVFPMSKMLKIVHLSPLASPAGWHKS